MKLRARHVAIHLVFIFAGVFLAPAPVPYHAALVPSKIDGVVEEVAVGLVAGAEVHSHPPLRHHRLLVQHQHAGHGVAAIHERGRALQNLHRVHRLVVDLYAVLVAPLLALLPDAVAHGDNAVVAQSAYDGFRYAAAGGQLADAWLMGNGVDDVGRSAFAQRMRGHHADRCRRAVGPGGAGQSRHHHLLQQGIVLLQGEVALGGGAQVNALNDGQVAHIAHLYGGLHLWQALQFVGPLSVGHRSLLQQWQIDAHPHHGLAVVLVGHPPFQGHFRSLCICGYGHCADHQRQEQNQ